MSRHVPTGSVKNRPSAVQSSAKSFTRFEPGPTSPSGKRARASTTQSSNSVGKEQQDVAADLSYKTGPKIGIDVFDKTPEEDADQLSPALSRSQTLPENFDELPVEIASLVDRYVHETTTRPRSSFSLDL